MGVTRTAKELLISFLAGNSETAPTHIAFGTEGTDFNEEDTSLGTENDRLIIDTTTTSGKEITFNVVLPSTVGDGTTYREVGLFNASTSGDMFQRSAFVDIDKTTNFEVQATITVRID